MKREVLTEIRGGLDRISGFITSCPKFLLAEAPPLQWVQPEKCQVSGEGDGTTPSALGTVTLSQVDTWLPHNLFHLDQRGIGSFMKSVPYSWASLVIQMTDTERTSETQEEEVLMVETAPTVLEQFWEQWE
ncbi:hypothetical protein CapIbe_018008 [Capra ibex]